MSQAQVVAPPNRMAGLIGLPTRVVLPALCLAQAWMIVFVLRLGPVVAVLDAGAGRGVHSGDLLALPLVGAALVLFAHEAGGPSRTAR